MRVAAVTGMEAEAQVARRAGIEALPSGGVPTQTQAIAERFLAEGVELLLSFGIAGALAPSLVPGSLLLPHVVIDDAGNRYPVDAHWHEKTCQVLSQLNGLSIEKGDLFGSRESIAKIAQKASLFQQKQSIAVDLESHIVARVAARSGTPFLVLRAIADSASRALPPAAVVGLGPDGKPALGRVLLSVARDPRQIPALIRLARDTNMALTALGSALETKPF
jgi:adenosylhomocysteine nucleosidase